MSFTEVFKALLKLMERSLGDPPPTPGTIKRVGALRSESHVAGHNRETLDVHIQLMLPLYNVLLIEKHSQTKIHLLSSVDFYQIYFIH